MQRPTCSNIRIRSISDAHKIFFAVQKGILPMITRRLDADERLALCSGCVYVWEQRGPHSELTGLGIERFTEGRRWSASRVREEFLFYYEKYAPSVDNHAADANRPRDWDPLIKQTYSVSVITQRGERKWHLTAYFTQATVDQLSTIDSLPEVRPLVVPEGTYRSTRVNKNRKQEDSRGRPDESSSSTTSTSTRTYAPFPSGQPSSPSFHYPPMQPCSTYEQPQQHDHHVHALPYSLPQYSVPPPLPPSQLSAPRNYSLRYQSDQGRPHPGYGQIDTLNGRTFPHSADHLSSHRPSYFSPSNPLSPPFPSVNPIEAHSAPKSGAHDISRDSSPVTQTFLEGQFSLFPTQPESPSFHPLRPHPDPRSDDITSNPYSSANHIQSDSRNLSERSQIPAPHLDYISGPRSSSARSSSGSPRPNSDSAESCSEGNSSGSIRACRLGLAPLHSLQRAHPYRRQPFDESALRLCGARTGSHTRVYPS